MNAPRRLRFGYQTTPPAESATPAERWFAVLDAAQDSTFLHLPARCVAQRASLYAGELGAMLDDVAPHLVEFKWDGPITDWMCARWSTPCGILLRSSATFAEIRKHLRRFLLVRDRAGRRFRFRFYDPRVLPAFLTSSTAAEIDAFFGPVVSYLTPTGEFPSVNEFAQSSGGLRQAIVPLAA